MAKLKIILTIAMLTLGTNVFAATSMVIANISGTLLTTNIYGNCMARLVISSGSLGDGCGADWVTFSCSGDFNSKDIAYHKYDNAQLSLVLDKQIVLFVDNTKLHNGYCFADRVDLYK